VTGRVEPGRVDLPCRPPGPGVGLVSWGCRAVSLLGVELDGFEKVNDMEEWFGDDLIGSTLEVLIRSTRVNADWVFDVGLLILPDWVTDGGVG
jgi:hypothetical protein